MGNRKRSQKATPPQVANQVMRKAKPVSNTPKVNRSSGSRGISSEFEDLRVPGKEIAVFNNAIKTVEGDMVHDYVKAVINPAGEPSRFIDSFTKPTSLSQSIQVIDMAIQLDTSADSGRFSVLVQPHLGSVNSPGGYCIAMTKAQNWPTDWTTSAAYANTIGGQDVRLDPNYAALTQPPLGNVAYSNDIGMTPVRPFGVSAVIDNGYGLSVRYDATSGSSVFYPPIGTYSIALSLRGTTFTSTANITGAGGAVVTNITDDYEAAYASGTWIVNIPHTGASLTIVSPLTAATIAGANISFTTTFSDEANFQPTPDNGAITEYRPGQCSVLCTFMGPELINGGTISAARLPGGMADVNYFVNSEQSAGGNLQNWENVAKLPESYNGQLKDGAYVYFAYEDGTDAEFQPPSKVLTHEYPTMVISGQYAPQQTPSGATTVTGIIRLTIVRNIEFMTPLTLYAKARCVGSQENIDRANKLMSELPTCMANAAHQSFFKKVWSGLKSAAGWAWKNRGTIGSVIESVVPLLA